MNKLFQHITALLAGATAAAIGDPALAANPAGFGPEAARASMTNFNVSEGLQLSLFSSEPMVRNPTDMDVDAHGRVWITEGVNYRSSFQKWGVLQREGDRIVILEDTNGDGAADKETVFYQDPSINAALGICVLGNKLIVSSSPDVFVLTDTDGDGKADRRELLFTGIGGKDHDHGVHAFVFGPDGKLYFNMGNEGKQLQYPLKKDLPLHGPVDKVAMKPVVDLDGNEVNDHGKPYRMGMVFRCNLDGSEVETLAWNFRNNYEVAVDSFGTLWQSDNDDDGNRGVRINFVMEHGNFGYADEMTGAGWHEGWDKAKAEGAGYKAETLNIVTTPDTWFRPADVCVAPDGSLYMADWNDAGVGGHNMADQNVEKMTGRIYRVAPPGSKASVPTLNLKTAAGCVEALQSPNQATRYLAWTKLQSMQSSAEKPLQKLWQDKDPCMRARALHLLARIPGRERKYIHTAIKDADPDIRITGLRIARELKLDVIPAVKALAHDDSAQVRRECALALRHNTSPEAPKLWAQLAAQHDGSDRWYLEALGIGADRQWDSFLEAWLAEVGEHSDTPAGRSIIWRSRSKKTPALLARIIKDKSLSAAERDHYFRALDFVSGPEKDAALIELLTE